MTQAGCPDPETLARYAESALDASAAEAVRTHLDGCAQCREVLVTLVRSSHPSPGPSSDTPWDVPLPGTMLGRYRVTGTRGAGGMGVVLAAYDPQLDRQIALKLLRPDASTSTPERSHQRLVREAQLMARVRHPNVVTVHDVVLEGERVVIAMELVQGQTLRDWLELKPRTCAEVLAVFGAAGQGLAAAHAAGVVHRDFKPDNVLVDERGQVLVSDFGLAWSQTAPSLTVEPARAQTVTSGLSRASATIGTPAYMAPEQLLGEPDDARADQFSFCVALYEALEHARPFEGNTVKDLLAAMEAGRIRPMVRTAPAQVVAAIQRGLSRSPSARFPSMEALLEQLRERSRVRRMVAIGIVLAAAVIAGLVWSDRHAKCGQTQARLKAVWPRAREDDVVARLSRQLSAERAAGAGAAVRDVVSSLESAWTGVCAGTDETSTRTRTCLEARVQQAEVTATVLALPQTEPRAVLALSARLEGADACLAGELLTLLPPPTNDTTLATIREARVAAMTADAARLSGKLDDAGAHAKRAVELARTTGWRPVEADALLASAQVSRARGRFDEAEAVLTEALLAAEAGRHFEALARIAVQHVLVIGTQTVRPRDAEPWVKRAEAALEQLPRPRLRAEVDIAITMLRAAQGRLDEGLAVSDRALEWTTKHDPVSTADLRSLRAQLNLQHGRHSMALDEARLAAELRLSLLGPSHPLSMHARLTLGEAQARAGLAADAEKTLTAALDEVRKRSDLNPVTAATGLAALSLALEGRGQPAEALVAATQARELVVSIVGPKHRYAALAERGVGERLNAMGRYDEAVETLLRAVAIGSEAVGAEHTETLESRAVLAIVQASHGDAAARREAMTLIETCAATPAASGSALVLSRLALAWTQDATVDERKAALTTAKRVRGETHPDVLDALLLEVRASKDAAAVAEATALFSRLQLADVSLAPLTLP
ncbi:MAG: protein kinase [Myxococcales bacterium]|nr:protein kinase [Myxococcales bacterium]